MKKTSTKQLVKFDFDVAVISALDAKYKDVQKITDGKSKALVMEGLGEYRDLRIKIDTMHKKLKKDILEAGRSLDGDKNRLKCLLEPGENHLKGIRKVWDDEKDRIKAAKEAEERLRIEEIQDKIISIRDLGIIPHSRNSSEIKQRLTLVTGIEISEEVYQDFQNQAIEVHKATVAELERALKHRLQFEKEEAERKTEIERLEEVRKKQEQAQKEIDEENRKIEEERIKIAEEKLAEQQRKEKEEMQKAAQEEADKWAKEKVEREACERLEKEEAEAKEKARQEALKPDKDKLIKFADDLYNIDIPYVKSAKAKEILSFASGRLDGIGSDIKEQAKTL